MITKANINLDLSDATNTALKNLSDKPTSVIGQMFADAFAIPASKIHYYAQKHILKDQMNFIEFLNSLRINLSNIPSDKLISPQSQILITVSDDVISCLDSKNLRDMFSSLLANSCNMDFSSVIHPSFSSTIKSMSPYDAQVFQKFVSEYDSLFVGAAYMVSMPDIEKYLILHECILFPESPFDDYEMQSLSISSLVHLGLINFNESEPYSPGSKFENNDYVTLLEEQYSGSNNKLLIRRVQVHLTPYGEAFVKACSLRKENP